MKSKFSSTEKKVKLPILQSISDGQALTVKRKRVRQKSQLKRIQKHSKTLCDDPNNYFLLLPPVLIVLILQRLPQHSWIEWTLF